MMEAGQLFPDLVRRCALTNGRGILPHQGIEELIRRRVVDAADGIDQAQIQPASLDLRLGERCWRIRASFLPGTRCTVEKRLASLMMHEFSLAEPTVLESGCIYLVELLEVLSLPDDVRGRANPKSSTGRIDVFARLISDYSGEFDTISEGYQGRMYLEVFPRTFSIVAQRGVALNQLRFIRGYRTPSDTRLGELHESDTLLYTNDTPGAALIRDGLWITADLEGNMEQPIVGYKARRHAGAIDLRSMNFYDVDAYWDAIQRNAAGSIVLEPEAFYILASREGIRIPPEFAAELVPFEASVGEFRIHYAGFFDPGFGHGEDAVRGARAVLEVRSHGVPFVLDHAQVIGRLRYEVMADIPTRLYGQGSGSSYQGQGLRLSKHFRQMDRARRS